MSLETLEGHTAPVLDIKFSPDGKYIATAAEDKLVKIWSASSLQEIATLTGNNSVPWLG